MKPNVIFLFTALLFFGLNFNVNAQTAKLSKDEINLLKAVLETALITEKNLPDFNNLPAKNEVWLYNKMVTTEDISKPPVFLIAKQIPSFKNLKIKLVTEAELKDSTRREDILFVRLGQLRMPLEKDQPAITHIMSQWALGKESRSKGFVHKQAFGNAMGFKKTKKGWEFLKTYYTFQNELGL